MGGIRALINLIGFCFLMLGIRRICAGDIVACRLFGAGIILTLLSEVNSNGK